MTRIKMHIFKVKLHFYPPCEVKYGLQNRMSTDECMMHVDKNADGHVVDQNVDRISREIAYIPLNGRIRSKRSLSM